MNKKLLFAAMSLAALTACSTDDFESQQQVAEGTSPIQFEVINNSDAFTRASMNTTNHKIVWNANDGDLFTLFHGATAPTGTTPVAVGGFENATYTAQAGASGGPATLTTPSMIKSGAAVMVWPADTIFRVGAANLSITVPAVQTNIENNIPYVSDLISITAHTGTGTYNEAGLNRSYPVYMRPMASQLIVKTDYNGTDAIIAPLYEGAAGVAAGEGISPIAVTSIALQANTEQFTTEIPLTFTNITAGDADDTRWDAAVPNNAWSAKTGFGTTYTTKSPTLTAKGDCLLSGNQGCTFLILPQAKINDGSEDATSAVIVNTNYGKVIVGDPTAGASGSAYSAAEAADAWYRYISNPASATTDETPATAAETSGDNVGKYKTTSEVKMGMKQTLNTFSKFTAPTGTGIVDGEEMGTWTTRYVKVLLNHIDMDGLHVTSDKQLYDAVRVWKAMGLDNATTHNITVKLDGDATTGEFVISQKTIKAINDLNAAAAEEETARSFSVQPCTDPGEACTTIVVTGGGEIAADLTFIKANGTTKADVVLNAGENWEWPASTTAVKKITVDATATGVNSIINKGTLTSNATAKLAVYDNAATPAQVNLAFTNAVTGIWNITAGDINAQFDVTNYGTVNISNGAEYHQDVYDNGGTATATTFTNEATTVPERFFLKDPTKTAAEKAAFVEQIGVVNNSGVFGVTGGTTKGVINNYGLIEHAHKDAKTYITANQKLGTGVSATTVFATAFNDAATSGSGTDNKMGRINLPYDNKDELNVSISAAAATGFVSVTVATGKGAPSDGKLSLKNLGTYVNYCIIKSGVTEIKEVEDKIKYLEFDAGTQEIAWNLSGGTVASPKTTTYDGLMVLSPVNIILTTKVVVNQAAYIAAKMYVGGVYTGPTSSINATPWSGYYGNTTSNADTMYITTY